MPTRHSPLAHLPPATLWAETFVAALAQAGLRRVVIAPGSRSTPLTLAFARRTDIRRYTAIDERSAAFFALGLALADGQPAALVCTSGSAAAEFYPAILEADAAEVPLLVLTADRPHELRHSGANQTTDQVKLYGDHVRWFVDVALPEPDPAPRTRRALHTLAARALAAAQGFHAPPGPVHLNFPFRKPLSPPPGVEMPGVGGSPLPEGEGLGVDGSPPPQGEGLGVGVPTVPEFVRGILHPSEAQVRTLKACIQENPRGLILCGPRCPNGDFPQAVRALAQASGYPVLAEPLSGVRFGPHVDGHILGGYEHYLHTAPSPQVVLRFGALPVGKGALTFLNSLPPETQVIHVSASGTWQDESHRLGLLLHADPTLTCRALTEALSTPRNAASNCDDWLCAWRALERAAWTGRSHWLPALLKALPEAAKLFVASSLSVRILGETCPPDTAVRRVFANRGLSGIDGTIASAAGAAAASRRPTLLLIGDLAFLHDMNSLHLLRHVEAPFVILLLNNNGGGIFHRLPIAAHEPPFTELFRMPHGMTFEHTARQFGLQYFGYAQDAPAETIVQTAAEAFSGTHPVLVEWMTDDGR
ncbi:MAG: 2-succinyl-5-enolpyruvyl-6-hydroxy-3-cyclohexene-1-carboxylic-acid synthase [Anaerolineales bacterium]